MIGRALCAASLAALLAGCPHVVRPTDPWRDARSVLVAHDSMRARLRQLSATARADRRGGPEGRLRGHITLVVQRPDHVRFEVMTQLGPVATLTSDGTRFALADQRDARFLTGPSCPENIERLTGLRLDARDATSVLLGSAPRIESVREEIVVDRATGHYVVTLHAQDGVTETLELGIRDVHERAPPMQQRLRLVRAEVHERDGTLRWRATYGDFHVQDGVAIPLTVRFEDEVHRTDTLLKLDDVILDHDPPSDAFVQEPLPGMHVEEVGCGG